jgi:hypothetical protein
MRPVAMKDARQLRSCPKLKVPSTPTGPVVKEQCRSRLAAAGGTTARVPREVSYRSGTESQLSPTENSARNFTSPSEADSRVVQARRCEPASAAKEFQPSEINEVGKRPGRVDPCGFRFESHPDRLRSRFERPYTSARIFTAVPPRSPFSQSRKPCRGTALGRQLRRRTYTG